MSAFERQINSNGETLADRLVDALDRIATALEPTLEARVYGPQIAGSPEAVRDMKQRYPLTSAALIEEARTAALASFTDLLDSIDSIVDDTHPEGDGCSLCEALDDMRALLDAETAGADAEGSREP